MVELSYDFLEENVVQVEVLDDFKMGPWSWHFKEKPVCSQIVFCGDELIIPKGTVGIFKQSCNHKIGLELENDFVIDVFFENDEELNEYVKFIKVIGPNENFIRKSDR
ncbi:gp603 [Bacillus phage G]|uniref:Gp603 n=1 Tax=Bacillus phage G TaxID=2884420 RepID=G3MAY3_9CAUD|nr:gp603 [Bacillus phage G]AEO93848.1 gp603 [Bacillus phage G]